MVDITITVDVPQLADLTQAVQEGCALLSEVIAEGVMQMAEASGQLTQAVTAVVEQLVALTASQQATTARFRRKLRRLPMPLHLWMTRRSRMRWRN